MTSKTVLYYSSNRERSEFEAKIATDLLLKIGSLPLVSVTQKPMSNVGQNICVGEVGLSYPNEYRQILIGLRAVQTEWICTAESDFLYAPEYFAWEPSGDLDCYRYDNVWVLYNKARITKAYRKVGSEGAMYCRRDWLIGRIEKYLSRYPTWTGDLASHEAGGCILKPYGWFSGGTPCLTFKTGDGVGRFVCGLMRSERTRDELTGWGTPDEIRRRFLQ